jgi:hypothetical protein
MSITEYDAKHVSLGGVSVLKESEKALLIDFEGEEHWIPKSQVHDDSDVYEEGDLGTIIISRWIAGQKGLL